MTVVSDQERVRRVVEDGSRRKRDLSVYRRVKAERERERAEGLAGTESAAGEAWALAAERLRRTVPGSTFRLWLEPLVPVGAEGGALLLDGPEGIRAWAERRYSSLIGQALSAVSDFTCVRFIAAGEGQR